MPSEFRAFKISGLLRLSQEEIDEHGGVDQSVDASRISDIEDIEIVEMFPEKGDVA